MPPGFIILIAIVQGITEFLPISSSAHLILMPQFLEMPDQGLEIDVATHIGTLGAVILYFRAEVMVALSGTRRLLSGRLRDPAARLALLLMIATIPVVAVGLALSKLGLTDDLRSMELIAWTTFVYGIALYIADRFSEQICELSDWNLRDAVVMGLAQALALMPGTSRSGITMTAARMLGYRRTEAARLSMLMSVPTILGAGILIGKDVAESGNTALGLDALLAMGLSFIAAWLALALMMKMLKSWSMTPFVIYRLLQAGLLFVVVYG